ncbi:hypothetical protein EW146_g3689 [Bondarzewia mesenterica]|uniref:Uncharacterized protein n=1 Tax=Bondarzewia mesenterica TaxID=1095465 RepID=A0A4S4LWU8_9AGAM|nr:hypothetical protein EW146_g3689 [Bondarzewia mesenterica]
MRSQTHSRDPKFDEAVSGTLPEMLEDEVVSSDAWKKSIAHFNSPGSLNFVFLLSTHARASAKTPPCNNR